MATFTTFNAAAGPPTSSCVDGQRTVKATGVVSGRRGQ